jgi:hypothetical protein
MDLSQESSKLLLQRLLEGLTRLFSKNDRGYEASLP